MPERCLICFRVKFCTLIGLTDRTPAPNEMKIQDFEKIDWNAGAKPLY